MDTETPKHRTGAWRAYPGLTGGENGRIIVGIVGYLGDFHADIGIVLGSGLSDLAGLVDVHEQIAFREIDGVPGSGVPGHAGKFVFGDLAGTPVVVARGRAHLYEGHSAGAVTSGVRFLAECGISTLVLTNAAGSLDPDFEPGHWMMLADHLNLTGASPFEGAAGFHDMSEVYSPELRARFRQVARERKTTLYEGVYAGVRGPQYETPAEVRMLRGLGADAVGMSTVLEAMEARALGLDVVGFSCLTNWGAGMSDAALNHQEVLETGGIAAGELVELIMETLV